MPKTCPGPEPGRNVASARPDFDQPWPTSVRCCSNSATPSRFGRIWDRRCQIWTIYWSSVGHPWRSNLVEIRRQRANTGRIGPRSDRTLRNSARNWQISVNVGAWAACGQPGPGSSQSRSNPGQLRPKLGSLGTPGHLAAGAGADREQHALPMRRSPASMWATPRAGSER